MNNDEKKLRYLLWLKHGHLKYLYGDDGEMQCHKCLLDFKRDSVQRIEESFDEQALVYLKALAEKLENKDGK